MCELVTLEVSMTMRCGAVDLPSVPEDCNFHALLLQFLFISQLVVVVELHRCLIILIGLGPRFESYCILWACSGVLLVD